MSKTTVTRDVTRTVLADIDATLRAHDRQRTAAAVERVLRTSTAGPSELAAGALISVPLCVELGIEHAPRNFCEECSWCYSRDWPHHVDLPGMRVYFGGAEVPPDELCRYAPWVVSPHVFQVTADRPR